MVVLSGRELKAEEGHWIALQTFGDRTVVQVSLFCRLRYVVDLAVAPLPIALGASAIFFDLAKQAIVPMPNPPLPEQAPR